VLWIDKQKAKITDKIKYNFTQTHNSILQLQTPLTNTQRLENWIKLGLWLILGIILPLLINTGWAALTGLYASVMVVIFWLKGWDPIAGKLAKYWQKKSLVDETVTTELMHISHSAIAEQRLLNIVTITSDWQSLSSKERNLKALRVLDAIYRVAVGMSPIVITTETTTVAPENYIK
jgi:hypothetical protein